MEVPEVLLLCLGLADERAGGVGGEKAEPGLRSDGVLFLQLLIMRTAILLLSRLQRMQLSLHSQCRGWRTL